MTERELYKQAFSALHSSTQIFLEEEEMIKLQKKHKTHMAVAAALVCAMIIGGSGTAYAADLGGIRQKLSLWLHGKETEVEATATGNGGYTFTYEEDGQIKEMGGGGVSIDENGNETWLYADELAEDMNRYADVYEDEDGIVHVYYYDQIIDITDLFDQDGICRILLSHNGEKSYLKVTRDADGSYPFSQRNVPEDDKELYLAAPVE